MSSPPDIHSPRQPWGDWLVILAFSTLLLLPTVDSFTGVDITDPPEENRLPAPKPQLNRWDFPGVQSYLARVENYFDDHFGFRKRLIRWFQQWKERLYHGNSANNLVITGQHGWLYISERQMIEHYLGLAKFTPAQLQAWQRLLEQRRDWLAARRIKYLMVIPPDKQTIYPEELPVWLLNAAPARRQSKLDQLVEYMQAHSTVEILDLRQSLLAEKKTAPTYLQNDTHWNLYGGFIACQALIKTLSRDQPGLSPLRIEDFDWTNRPASGGDLARMLGSEASEPNYYEFTPKIGVMAPQNRLATNIVCQWNPHQLSVVSENPGPLTATAVVFGDSFSKAWQEFLGYSFKRVVFMTDNREFNTRVILENKPDVVVNEIVERFVNTMDPQEMITKDALP